MKFRSSLLVVLMVIVPALAMFSHHVPAGLPAAASRLVVDPVVEWVTSWREAAGPGASARVARVEPLVAADTQPTAPQAITAADRAAVRDRLRDAGAVAVECRQLPGAATAHLASCRVALDADGQLQRVFQATGHDPLAAERHLLEEITAWQERRSAAQ
ncbi:MAG: hypothetical protein WCC69_13595 [Pirellulales bacterium]